MDVSKDVFRLTLLDVATLLALAVKGAEHPEVGYEDTTTGLERLKVVLGSHPTRLKKTTLESLLWSANLMDEAGAFWSPIKDESFERFVTRILGASGHTNIVFDRRYNVIETKGKTNDNQ